MAIRKKGNDQDRDRDRLQSGVVEYSHATLECLGLWGCEMELTAAGLATDGGSCWLSNARATAALQRLPPLTPFLARASERWPSSG
jgi:hypothetical protein